MILPRVEAQRWRQFVIASIANLSALSYGICLGWTSPVLPKLQDLKQSPLPELITVEQVSWIGSFLNVGAIFGPFIGGFLTSRIGRKWSLQSSAAPVLVGWVLIAASTSVETIYAGRVLWGLSCGMTMSVTPMYCAEIATDKDRGAIGTLFIMFVTLGLLLVYVVGAYVSYSVLAYVCVSVTATFSILFYFMPESPFYHLLKNDRESAAECLCFIRGQDLKSVQGELDKMAEEVEASKARTSTLKDLLHGSNLKATLIAASLIFFHVFSGIDALLYYMTKIFEMADTGIDVYTASIIISVTQVVAASTTALVVDRLGRRILLMVSSVGTTTALSVLGAYFYLHEIGSDWIEAISFLPILCLAVFIVMYCWGLGTLPWVIVGEIFAVEIRPVAIPIVCALLWSFAFLVTRFFGPIGDAAGYHVPFWIFAGSCFVAFLFAVFILPETKGKSFQEIQDLLANRSKKLSKLEET